MAVEAREIFRELEAEGRSPFAYFAQPIKDSSTVERFNSLEAENMDEIGGRQMLNCQQPLTEEGREKLEQLGYMDLVRPSLAVPDEGLFELRLITNPVQACAVRILAANNQDVIFERLSRERQKSICFSFTAETVRAGVSAGYFITEISNDVDIFSHQDEYKGKDFLDRVGATIKDRTQHFLKPTRLS